MISQAKANNKKVSIAVARGLQNDGLPSWLSSLMFTCSDSSVGPIPWDTIYKKEWIELWKNLAERYENDPTVVMYHIGGIYSWHTPDWDLCDATAVDKNNWLNSGYQIEKIKQFALEFAQALAAKTKKPFILPIAGTMDNNGKINTSQNTNDFIIKPLFDLYGPTAIAVSQFGIMRTVFQVTTPDPLGIWNVRPLGDQFGTLYNWKPYIAGQRQSIAHTSDELKIMFDISLHYNIQFMELGSTQILTANQDDLGCYNTYLGILDVHCGH